MDRSRLLQLRGLSWSACGVVVVMISLFVASGVGQDGLQVVRHADEYGRLLLRNPGALRATLACDNLFIALYSGAFVLLLSELLRQGGNRLLLGTIGALLAALTLLDLAENLHFLVMLRRAELGSFPTEAEVAFQVGESLLKFHCSYVGLFLLGLALPRTNGAQRTLAWLCTWLQLPVGILIHVTPPNIATPLVFVRFIYFTTALALLGWSFTQGAPGAPDRAAVGSGARA